MSGEGQRFTVAEALEEVGLTNQEMCPCGCGPRATLHLRGFTVSDPPDERLVWLDQIEALLRQGERDASLLDARDHDAARWEEALALIEVLRTRALAGDRGEA